MIGDQELVGLHAITTDQVVEHQALVGAVVEQHYGFTPHGNLELVAAASIVVVDFSRTDLNQANPASRAKTSQGRALRRDWRNAA
ncbi:hypothetical protein TUM20249_12320 [Pseudomonas tohonis]|nr:hypothetical protein TUM20249_12320 [Pseudomonas tohonis]